MKINLVKKVATFVKKNSPEILAVSGAACVVAGTVLACKETIKAKEILEESKETIEQIHGVRDLHDDNAYSEQDYKKDLTIVYTQTGIKLAKTYALPAVLTIGGISCLFGSSYILKQRNLALTAAYAALNDVYKKYRENVKVKYGENVDKAMRYGLKSETVEEVVTDEDGKEKKKKTKVEVVDPEMPSGYARFFDSTSRAWEKDPETNLMFLKAQEAYANQLLKANGRLFLNEVYDLLDIPRSKAGQVVGWVYDPESVISDNYVDFGIYECNRNNRAVNGIENVFLLDFNVDGNVWESM